jgi:LysM repeat protein
MVAGLSLCRPGGLQANIDSVGLKIFSNNKVFIVHQVDKGQGIYGIAKRYGVEVKDIEAYNPDVKTQGLKVDQYVFVPTELSPDKARELIAAADKAKEAKATGTGGSKPVSRDDNVVYHTVKAGETLFSVSRLAGCKFTIDEIKKWNGLKTNEVKEGQRLIIAFIEEVKVPVDPVTKNEVKGVVEGETGEEVTGDTAKVVWSEVRSTGLATWIPDVPDYEGKSYALYSKAKVGTIIRIENLANNKATYVRVIGPLAGTEKKDVVMVVTESTAKRLEVTDAIFRIELIYTHEEI